MKGRPAKNSDLHGNVPENSPVALLLIDVINDMAFEGAEALVRHAAPMARQIAALKRRARAAKIPAVYINDNFGRWRSDFRKLVDHVLNDGVPGEEVARILEPDGDDYFVLKPKHSAFFETTLDTLLSSNTPEDNHHALHQIEQVLKGDITPSGELDLDALVRDASDGPR